MNVLSPFPLTLPWDGPTQTAQSSVTLIHPEIKRKRENKKEVGEGGEARGRGKGAFTNPDAKLFHLNAAPHHFCPLHLPYDFKKPLKLLTYWLQDCYSASDARNVFRSKKHRKTKHVFLWFTVPSVVLCKDRAIKRHKVKGISTNFRHNSSLMFLCECVYVRLCVCDLHYVQSGEECVKAWK